MKKMIPLVLYGLALFGVSAGVGWVLRPQPVVEEEPETSDAVNPNVATMPDMNLPGTSPTLAEGSARPGAADTQQRPEDRLPTAVRTEPMTVEEIVSMSLSLKSRQTALTQREDALQRTEAQHQLLMADMQAEQREIESLVETSKLQKAAVEELLQMVMTTKQQVDTARVQLDEDKKNFAAEVERQKARAEKTNQELQFEPTRPGTDSPGAQEKTDAELRAELKPKVEIVEAMKPETARDLLVEMANDGKLRDVGVMLGMMEQKKASAIMDLLVDSKLSSSILDNVPQKPVSTRTANKR